jgi:hypothetical protein
MGAAAAGRAFVTVQETVPVPANAGYSASRPVIVSEKFVMVLKRSMFEGQMLCIQRAMLRAL